MPEPSPRAWKMDGPRTQISPLGQGESVVRYCISGTSTSLISQEGTGGPQWPVVRSAASVLAMTHADSVMP